MEENHRLGNGGEASNKTERRRMIITVLAHSRPERAKTVIPARGTDGRRRMEGNHRLGASGADLSKSHRFGKFMA